MIGISKCGNAAANITRPDDATRDKHNGSERCYRTCAIGLVEPTIVDKVSIEQTKRATLFMLHRTTSTNIENKRATIFQLQDTTIDANMMLIVLVAILYCASASGADIRQVELDDSMLVFTSATNYAITSPELSQQLNWKSVSNNGNQVTIITSTCQSIVKDLQALSQAERAQLTNNADRLIVADLIGNPNGNSVKHQGRHSASKFSLASGGNTQTSRNDGKSNSQFQMNGLSVNKQDENNYSISKPDLPNGIVRMFVSNGDMVTFVHADGRVLMKPIICLDGDENQSYQQLKAEFRQAQLQFDANMRQMQENLNRKMMNMQ